MIPEDKDRLLDEILANDEFEQFRRSSAEQLLAAVRRSRTRRRLLRTAVLALPLVAALTVVLVQHSKPAHVASHRPEPAPRPRVTPTQNAKQVQIINDDELFALFPDRPVALIGPPGRQRLVVLDGSNPPRSPRPL